METWHTLNIYLHVVSGSIALLLGLIALLSKKGGRLHRKAGQWFLSIISIVIITGLLGVFVFGRNTFLLVITVLSGYVAYSGFRVLKLKNNRPNVPDILVAMATLIVLAYFLYYFREIGMIWSPVIIYSTVGALLLVIVYDFCKYLIPQSAYTKRRIWLYEHIYKMTSAFAALLSAFSGTVLDEYQPYSQFLPSLLGILIIIGFMISISGKNSSYFG